MNYRRKAFKARLIAAGIVALLGFSCIQNVTASALSNAKNKKDEAQSNLDSTNQQIESLESQQAALQTDIDALDADLVTVLVNLDVLEGEIVTKQQELEDVTVQLAQAEEDEQTQYEAMKQRIRYMYEHGDSGFVDAIIGAENFADMINRVEYAKQVYDYDRDQLTTYQETVQQVADLKTQVEQEQDELLEVQQSLEEQQGEYETMIAAKQSQIADFDTQLATAKDLAAQFKDTVDQQNTLIAQEQAKPTVSNTNTPNTSTGNPTSGGTTGGKDNNTDANGGNGDNSSGGDGSGGGANPGYTTSVSGSEVVSYASQFIGNPYVWGGESLTDGADCSGFIMSVYAHFGISLPHSSSALQRVGNEVSYANAQPGDIICYAGHVAIYTGGGGIVHASTPASGITTGSATYRTIITVRRVL